MRDVSQHFELIEKAVEYSGATEAEIEIKRRDATRGLINGVVYFADGSRLEFSERVVIEKGRPVKSKYRYQFVRDNVTIFRYDNAPHHEHVTTHPHHKHAGSKILPAIEPEFGQILDEVAALLLEAVNQPGKKWRQRKPRSK
ncbi:MAG: toxin-antitoxin system TumE family protein [Blastocatellia bacterium]